MESPQVAQIWQKMNLPPQLRAVLEAAPDVVFAERREDLLDWALGREAGDSDWASGHREDTGTYKVSFDVPGRGKVEEAEVVRLRNGLSINYVEAKMRRRDPDAMVIGDKLPTDKPTYKERFGKEFDSVREETFDWLKKQPLIVVPFYAGPDHLGYGSLMVCPREAGFFAGALADLQGMVPASKISGDFSVKGGILYVAPPFRHTHFEGRQVVVHNRLDDHQEIFSYNLYPGPSAKKGVYSILLHLGEKEGWVTNHCSVVQVETPYDNIVTIMHEGASGGGKSEMIGHIHRMEDGHLLVGKNVVTQEERSLALPESCHVYPMMDDMGAAHPSYNKGKHRLHIEDAEAGWFVRVDHIKQYGTDPYLEKLAIDPPKPLLFMNHHAVPGGLALIWEHTEDEPGVPCPNPRLIIPREMIKDIRNDETAVQVRSFGVRCPPTHKDSQLYGILGMLHVLNPALGWLWRLVAPRGHGNPSIQERGVGMQAEGVGSYWAFCTGRRVDQANLLLRQIRATLLTKYVLIPNQHIGAWKIGFMSEWLMREYLSRRGGAKFRPEQLVEARCPLLGRIPYQMKIEGQMIPRWFLQPETQPEMGTGVYDKGAAMLTAFFKKELEQFLVPDLDPLGQKIIQCCLDDGSISDYDDLIKVPTT